MGGGSDPGEYPRQQCKTWKATLIPFVCRLQKVKGILNESRSAHTKAVQARIDSVGEMKDVVTITEQMFALSKVCESSNR